MCNFPFKISPKRKWKIEKENEKSKKKMKNPRRKWKIQKEIEKSSCIHDFYYFRSFVLVCSTMQTVSCMEHVIQCTHLLKTINIYKHKLKYKCLLTSKQKWTFDYYYWQRNLNFSRLYPKHTSIHNLTLMNWLHSRHLRVQGHQWKHRNIKWNFFKLTIKTSKRRHVTGFRYIKFIKPVLQDSIITRSHFNACRQSVNTDPPKQWRFYNFSWLLAHNFFLSLLSEMRYKWNKHSEVLHLSMRMPTQHKH